MTAESYPLSWPTGWPRTLAGAREDSRYRFKTGGSRGYTVATGTQYTLSKAVTFDVARKKLCDEMDRLRASNLVISTNLPLRNDGYPRAGASWDGEPGVAVYFTYHRKQMAMACDRYDAPSANLRSLGLAIEAMRQLERHGGGMMMERAFAGFAALPPPGYKRPWRDVLEFVTEPNSRPIITRDAVMAQYRLLATVKHPDKGGTEAAMSELNVARDDALREISA